MWLWGISLMLSTPSSCSSVGKGIRNLIHVVCKSKNIGSQCHSKFKSRQHLVWIFRYTCGMSIYNHWTFNYSRYRSLQLIIGFRSVQEELLSKSADGFMIMDSRTLNLKSLFKQHHIWVYLATILIYQAKLYKNVFLEFISLTFTTFQYISYLIWIWPAGCYTFIRIVLPNHINTRCTGLHVSEASTSKSPFLTWPLALKLLPFRHHVSVESGTNKKRVICVPLGTKDHEIL